MSKPHTEENERAPRGSDASESSQTHDNNHVMETSEANSSREKESVDSQPLDHTNGNGSAEGYESAEHNGHQHESTQSETSGPNHSEKQVEESKQSSKEDTPKSEKDKVVDQAKKDLKETEESVNKAKDTLKDLASGKANIVDAAFAVKGAIDAVKGLTGKLSSAAMMPVLKALSAFKGQAVLPAGKQMDPVMGIDVHMVTIPPSPAPVPLPHPYIGILFNPKDFISCAINTVKPAVMAAIPEPAADAKPGIATSLAKNKDAIAGIAMGIAGLSASVKFGSFIPRAVTGTPTKNIPHIPMGAGFHPAFVASVAKNHGKAFLGSLFVAADGDPMVGSFHLHYDCWDVGIVDLFKGLRKGTKKAEPGAPLAQLYVPSGTVLPIPWGKPVLVNSIPTPINPLALLDKLFKAGLGKLKAAGRKAVQKGLDKLTGKVGCGALSKVSKLIGTGQSHPVDVAEGHFYTDNIDFSLPGPIPLVWERTWYSYSDYKGPLGYGWHHSYDMALAVDEETRMAVLRMSDGRVTDFELPSTTEGTFKRSEKLTLCRHDEGYFYVTDKNGLIYRFTKNEYINPYNKTSSHLLQSIANRNGFAIRLTYNEEGLLNRIIDSAGRKLKVNNDDSGRIVNIEAPHPELRDQTFETTRYAYSPEGDMSHHFDALNQAMSFEYENHLMVREIWRNGLNWHFRYDRKKGIEAKCIEVWGDDDLLHYKFDYSSPEYTVVINSLGHKKIFYHKNGVVIKYIDPNGGEWKYRYNEYNEIQGESDPSNNAYLYTHDKWGNVITSQDPAGGFKQTEFNNPTFPFLVTAIINPAGGVSRMEYDKNGNLVESLNSLNARTIYEYSDGLLTKIIKAAGTSISLQYDSNQNIVRVESGFGASTKYEYDLLGNCVLISNSNDLKQKRKVDLKGRIIHAIFFDINHIFVEYDPLDNILLYRDKFTNIKYTYDGLGNLISTSESGATSLYNYDTEGQLTRIINEQGLSYDFELDSCGNITKEVGFDNISYSYKINSIGLIDEIVRPGNRFTKYKYDPCGRITCAEYSDGKKQFYSYGHDGYVNHAEDDVATIDIERDVVGNITRETVNKIWISSKYDKHNNKVNTSTSLGAIFGREYNTMNGQVALDANGKAWEFEYDILGCEISRQLPGGIVSQWERDKVGRPISHTWGNKSIETRKIRTRKYVWDADWRLKQIRDGGEITQFEYDSKGNLNKTIFPGGDLQYRNTDHVGNLFKSSDRRDRIYGKGGQLRKASGWEFHYDVEGYLVEKRNHRNEKWKYQWSHSGQLMRITRPDNDIIELQYDAFGRRISKKYKNTITKFVWDGNLLLHEWKEHAISGQKLSDSKVSEDGTITWVYDANSFVPIGKLKGQKVCSILSDHVGTPFQMYNEAGILVWDCSLDSYGKARMEKGESGSCPFRFQGQYEDYETGLYYNRFRYYDPETGVYISQDPIGLLGGSNLYAYVNNPNLYVDRFGLNTGIGNIGEDHVKDDITKKGDHSEVDSIQNNSGHGVDILAKNSKTGEWEAVEVKTTTTNSAPGLSPAQSMGADAYSQDRLNRAATGQGHYKNLSPADKARAAQILAEIKKQGGIKVAHKYEVFVDSKGKVISVKKKAWTC